MPKNNSKVRKAQRQGVAEANAKATQVDCADCGNRHREGRHNS